MKLRTRIFLLVGGLFSITMVIVGVIRHVQINMSIQKASDEIHAEIHKLDQQKRADVFSFLGVEFMEVEMRINALLEKVRDFEWLKIKYEPSLINFRTNDWSNSGVLLLSNQWIDMIQTTNRGKVTSHIEIRPPYLRNYIRIPTNNNLDIFIEDDFEDNPEMYIGIPYWENKLTSHLKLGLHEMRFGGDEEQDYWLLFTAQQLLAMDTSKLNWHGILMPTGPLEPTEDIHSQKAYQGVVEATIEEVKILKEKIEGLPQLVEIMNSKQMAKSWIREKIGSVKKTDIGMNKPPCLSYLCRQFQQDQLKWLRINDWAERGEQNRLVWELTTITGSGLWGFDPLSSEAPKGIVSFPTAKQSGFKKLNPNLGKGMYADDVFFSKADDIYYDCKLDDQRDKMDTCISDSFQIVWASNGIGVFIVNTMEFEDIRESTTNPPIGTLSVGVDILPVLQELALASPDKVLFVTKDGRYVSLDTQGEMEAAGYWKGVDFQAMMKSDHGVITDSNGDEYYYLHITPIVEGDGHVFLVQFKDSELLMVDKLKKATMTLSHQITVQYVIITLCAIAIALIVLNRIISKITRPIRRLARGTKQVAEGNYDQINISEESRSRTDEIGMLVGAFAQMVDDLKKGEEVRGILNKVVSKEVAEKIIHEGVALGGEVREVTMIFADIRNFTTITEKMPPQEVLEMLNDCLNVLSQVIDDNNGVIDKYVGDEIIALFGAPLDCKNSALRAVECAKSMRAVLTEWNHQRDQVGKTPLPIGIAVHTGEVIAGNIGAEKHLSYTVLGHNVNLTARICDKAGPMEILVTDAVIEASGVKENIQTEPLEPLILKGVTDPVNIHRVL